LIFYYHNKKEFDEHAPFGTIVKVGTSDFIMLCLFIEHVFSYFCAFFREYDIKKNGKIDINGIKRAPNESIIGNVQFFIGCIIIGFTINHYIADENSSTYNDHEEVVLNYWITIDIIILFLG